MLTTKPACWIVFIWFEICGPMINRVRMLNHPRAAYVKFPLTKRRFIKALRFKFRKDRAFIFFLRMNAFIRGTRKPLLSSFFGFLRSPGMRKFQLKPFHYCIR